MKDNRIWFGPNGNSVPAIKRFLSEVKQGVVSKTIWFRTEVGDNQEAKKETLSFNNDEVFATPKPERLIYRALTLATNPGDWVLDSFLGSGTTAGVAHKMGRRWIGIELGEHAHTHCLPRLKKVVDGTDQGGISKAVNWQGGGGFKYYYLAPSLLKEDKYGNWIIDERYNANMLAAAMAKHEGFKYSPDEYIYWKQGRSTEKDYIFTTTNFITVEFLDKINEEMQPDESLLICCKSFSKACGNRYPNITVKKIPNLLLGRCEFGREDYSLNIVNMPVNLDETEFVPSGPVKEKKKVKKKFDQKICLWGGVSGAVTIEMGTEEQVRSETKKAIDTLGPSGFILSPVDNITLDAPLVWSNIELFKDEWRRYSDTPTSYREGEK